MIYAGGSAIADIKFGSRQIAKVYHGGDAIWEKSGMLELTWGDDFYLSLTSGSGTTRSGYGFTMRTDPNGRFDFMTRVKPAVDDGTYSKPTFEQFSYEPPNGTTKNSLGSNVIPYFVMQFPFDVYLQEIRIYDVGDRDMENATPHRVDFYPNDINSTAWKMTSINVLKAVIRTTPDPDKGENIDYRRTQGNWDVYASFSGRQYNNDSSRQFMYYNLNHEQVFGDALYDSFTNAGMTETAIRKLIIDPDMSSAGFNGALDKPDSSTGTIWGLGYGRVFIRFKVARADYEAWKTQYASALASASDAIYP